MRGFIEAMWNLMRIKPKVVIGVGGYASGPTVAAAGLLRIPTLIQEQNYYPGLTNRLLASWVTRVAISFEESRELLGGRGVLTGNPIRGEFHTTRPACVIFRQQRSGRIINTGSTSGLGNRGQANYSAAKEGIIGLTRTVARDMGKYGVSCNAIRPNAGTRMTLSEDMKQAAARSGNTTMVDFMEKFNPDDIAPLVVWLASDASANVNGRDFFVQTGRVAIFTEPVPENAITKDGAFTIDELFEQMPTTVAAGVTNPAPPEAPKE